jgi:hypothetical protein
MTMATRILASAAAAAALAVAAPAMASGQASPAPDTEVANVHDGDGQNERVIVLTDRLREHQNDAGADEHRRVRVYGMGGANMADCTDHPLVDQATPDGHDRTRVIVCGHRELSEADRSAQLEHVIERVQHMEGLSDSSKERVTAALREAIGQLRNTH